MPVINRLPQRWSHWLDHRKLTTNNSGSWARIIHLWASRNPRCTRMVDIQWGEISQTGKAGKILFEYPRNWSAEWKGILFSRIMIWYSTLSTCMALSLFRFIGTHQESYFGRFSEALKIYEMRHMKWNLPIGYCQLDIDWIGNSIEFWRWVLVTEKCFVRVWVLLAFIHVNLGRKAVRNSLFYNVPI